MTDRSNGAVIVISLSAPVDAVSLITFIAPTLAWQLTKLGLSVADAVEPYHVCVDHA